MKELEQHIYADAKSVAEWVKETFGVTYTPASMMDLLNRIGFTYKKTTEVPCEANAEEQRAFVQMIKERFSCKKEGDIYYYADGTHPTHNTRSTYTWIRKGRRLEQPTVSGWAQVNINRVFNAHDITDVIAHECPSVNADSTIALYRAALERPPEAKNIYIITDVTEAPQVFSGDRSEAVVGEWLIGARVDRGVKDDVFRPRTTRDVGRHLPKNTFGRQLSVCRKLSGQEDVGLIPIDFPEVVRERFHQVFGGRRDLRNHRSIVRKDSVKAMTRSCNRWMSAAYPSNLRSITTAVFGE